MRSPLRRPLAMIGMVLVVSVPWSIKSGNAQRPPVVGNPKSPATVDVMAAIVLDAVDVKPLPLLDLWLLAEGGADTARFTTGLDGKVHATLRAGRYRLVTPKPPVIRGVQYQWSQVIAVAAGQALVLELTNSNATLDSVSLQSSPTPPHELAPEAVVYDRVRRGVVRITAGLGMGSGFFADTLGGVILTNDHVAGVPGPIYVVLDSTHRYEAQRLAHDHETDVAVLRIASTACPDCPRLPLARKAPDQPLVVAGERVIAIGFPLHQERTLTSGIVSSLRESAIISDVNINHGNSGGPLLNARGEVLAINTFGDIPDNGGPGISGSILINHGASVLAKARDSLATAPEPDPTALPTLPLGIFSLATLRSIADSAPLDDYRELLNIEAGPFTITLTTPVVAAVRERVYTSDVSKDRQKREGKAKVAQDERYSALRGSREWEQYVGDARTPAVALEVAPKLGETGGSLFKRMMLGPGLKAKYTFKGDVRGVTLWRDSATVAPLLGGHGPVEVYVDNQWVSMKDVADRAYYVFDPRVFRPEVGGEVPRITLVIDDLKHPDKRACVTLGRKEVARIWNDFQSFFAEHPDSLAFVQATPQLPQRLQRDLPESLTGCGLPSPSTPTMGRP